jgi:Protein of unknown function
MDREQAAEIFEHLFEAARELDEARAAASALAAQDERAASLEAFIAKLNSKLIEALLDEHPGLKTFGEFPTISSTVTWDQVQLPQAVTEVDIDTIVLSAMKPQWQKVARVVVQSSKRCEELGHSISDEVLAARIRALAESGRLEGAGDLRKWRHSEVRLKD